MDPGDSLTDYRENRRKSSADAFSKSFFLEKRAVFGRIFASGSPAEFSKSFFLEKIRIIVRLQAGLSRLLCGGILWSCRQDYRACFAEKYCGAAGRIIGGLREVISCGSAQNDREIFTGSIKEII